MASIFTMKNGMVAVDHPKGTVKEFPSRTRSYFGKGPSAKYEAEEFFRRHGLTTGKKKDITDPTFSELTSDYLLIKEAYMTDRSYDLAAMHLEVHLIPFFGTYRVGHIDDMLLAKYVKERKKHVKQSTIRREIATLNAVINLAVKRKTITYNPIQYAEKPKEDDAVIAPPSEAEIKAILNKAVPHLKRFILLSYFTGARPGVVEVLSLQWSDVDLINGMIEIESAKKGGRKKRQIRLHPDLLPLMIQWHDDDTRGKYSSNYIIHYFGTPVRNIRKAWNATKQRAGITRRLRPYDLRHASATAMLQQTQDLKSVSEILGHSNPATTNRTYNHVNTRQKEIAINSLPSVIENDKQDDSEAPIH